MLAMGLGVYRPHGLKGSINQCPGRNIFSVNKCEKTIPQDPLAVVRHKDRAPVHKSGNVIKKRSAPFEGAQLYKDGQ